MMLEDIFKQDKNKEEIFSEVAGWMQQHHELKAYFCSIAGKRWSFMAGSRNVDIPRHRFQLDDDTGLIVESLENIENDKWEQILNTIQSNI